MFELRIHDLRENDKREDFRKLLISEDVLWAVLKKHISPEDLSSDWFIQRAWGYGEDVCAIEDALEKVDSFSIDYDSLNTLLEDQSQYFNDVDIVNARTKIVFGVFDNTILFVRSKKRKFLETVASAFKHTEIIKRT